MWLHGPQKSPQRPAVPLQQQPPRAASRDDFVEDGGGAPRCGRRSMVSADGKEEEEASAELPIPSTSPQRPQQQPKQMRQRDPLLASLDSLSAFAHSHRGRLGRTVEQREGGGGGNDACDVCCGCVSCSKHLCFVVFVVFVVAIVVVIGVEALANQNALPTLNFPPSRRCIRAWVGRVRQCACLRFAGSLDMVGLLPIQRFKIFHEPLELVRRRHQLVVLA